MQSAILQAEPLIRILGFATIFAVMAGLEVLVPLVRLPPRASRWRTNFGLTIAATLILRVLVPFAAVASALWAQAAGIGLFNLTEIPPIVSWPLTLLALDVLIYGQHVVFHRFGLFWRFHKVHHADPALDVTTALRFHPLEILISQIIKMATVIALGAPPEAVLIFEVLLNGMAMFNHANLKLGATANRVARRIIVTPDMHRSHHSTQPDMQMKNFGFNLSLWDRIFATYHAASPEELAETRIGLVEYAGDEPTQFIWSLTLPFLKTMMPDEKRGEPTR